MAEDPGFLLVQAGLVRDDQLLNAREARAQSGGTLGEHLVLAGFVDDDTLTEFYASRLVIPRVAAEELARIPPSVLKRIPSDMAAEFRVVPIASDGELNLTLAMSDPANKHVVDEVAFFTGSYIVRAVATQLQIAWCLAHYYGIMTPLARARLVPPDESAAERERHRFGARGGDAPWISHGTPAAVEEEEETGPARMPLVRRRPIRRRGISELAPRSGTLEVPAAPREPERLPAVVVDEEELTGQRDFQGTDVFGGFEADDTDPGEADSDDEMTMERPIPAEPPILLERPRSRSSGQNAVLRAPTGSGEVLLLDQVKRRQRHPSSQTEPGLGRLGSVDSLAQASHDTEASRGSRWDENAGENDAVSRKSKSERRGRKSRAHGQATPVPTAESVTPIPGSDPLTDPMREAAPVDALEVGEPDSRAPDEPAAAEPPPDWPGSRADSFPDDAADAATDPGEAVTEPMRQLNGMRSGMPNGKSSNASSDGSGNAPAGASVDDGWDVDDGWGAPGTTIPAAYLGARPGSEDDDTPTPAAGVPAPLDAVALAAGSASAIREPEPDPAEVAAELERSSNRLLETLRALERALGRDEVVDILLDHLGPSLRRRAFFAVKGGVLFAFRQQGSSRPGIGVAELALQPTSTFGHVAQSRIPFRGHLSRDASDFVERALGSPGLGEVVVVPVAVRGRSVGLIYGDGFVTRLFDEHQAVLGRAAGQALERILTKRASRDSQT